MLDTSSRKLVAWDGTTDGAAVGILAVAADQTSTTLTFLQVRHVPVMRDVLWPEAASDETKKRTAFAGTANQHRLT
ncbi:head decoration protein [Escherichia coli]|uniref:head decoration protein n=1 Tax=Escherichia coli TaxID=562 RepID=UPI0039A6F604